MSITNYIETLCKSAKKASASLAVLDTNTKNRALESIAAKLEMFGETIIAANAVDMEQAPAKGVPKTMMDRLMLNEKRIKKIADSLREVCLLPDPIGAGEVCVRPNGLKISRIHTPLGVIAIIYEARPEVTVDAASLCLKSGNAVILRGGKEAINSNRALVNLMRAALNESGIDENSVSLVDDVTREGTNTLLTMREYVDVLIPRGGKAFIQTVAENSRIPVIETGAGNCHCYIDKYADIGMAVEVAL
ncbi:MAG: glutamate-5-semialdehyde dehydrogenase, partial [Oscillospiraceae bacterium]|nr:glutamate-5-semialdehyde dehydrogenase [Oscillospiraceae bacterium]